MTIARSHVNNLAVFDLPVNSGDTIQIITAHPLAPEMRKEVESLFVKKHRKNLHFLYGAANFEFTADDESPDPLRNICPY